MSRVLNLQVVPTLVKDEDHAVIELDSNQSVTFCSTISWTCLTGGDNDA